MCLINTHLYISHCITAKPEVTKQIFIYLLINPLIPSIPLKIYYRQLIIFYFSSYLLQTFLFDVQAWTLVARQIWLKLWLILTRDRAVIFHFQFLHLFYFGIFTVEQCVHGCVLKACKLFSDIWYLFALSPFTTLHIKKANKPQVYKVHVWPVLAAFGRSVCKPSDMIWIILQALKPRLDFFDWKKAAFACPVTVSRMILQ